MGVTILLFHFWFRFGRFSEKTVLSVFTCIISCRRQLAASTFCTLYCWGTAMIALRTYSLTRSCVQRWPSIPDSSFVVWWRRQREHSGRQDQFHGVGGCCQPGASQPSSTASAGDPTPASSLWDKLNATNDATSQQIILTAGNLPRRADTFAQPKSTVLVGDELPKVSVSSSSRQTAAGNTSHVSWWIDWLIFIRTSIKRTCTQYQLQRIRQSQIKYKNYT